MMFAWAPTSQKRRNITWLMLLALLSVNSVLAWHQAAHAFEQHAIQSSSHPVQTAAQLGDHCDLCLSAHGYNSAPIVSLLHLPTIHHQGLWVVPPAYTATTTPLYRSGARAPPVSLSF